MAANNDLQLVRQVLQIRYWQHLVNERMKKGVIKAAVHMAFGHEAIAVAVSSMMQAEDQLVLSHRNIAYHLARAGNLRQIFDEYRQRPSGISGARLGTMNMANVDRGLVYTSSILGNNMPVACGLALAKQILGKSGIVTVLTGDGAMEEGTFYESLQFSKSQKLRWLLIVENNKYAMASTINDRRCPIHIADLCKAVDTPFLKLTGNWVPDYAVQMAECRRMMVERSSPACIEVDLFNINRHAGATPGWPADPMNIDITRGLVVKEDDYDPVFVAKKHVDPNAYAEIEQNILSEPWSD
jgi:TPP-dependent pyruvate/acetoin dehydrogenase alpha subunit